GQANVLRAGKRRAVRAAKVGGRDVVLTEHVSQDFSSASVRGLRARDGVVAARVGGQAGEERGLGQRELLRARVEVRLCGALDPVRAVSEVDRVQVRRQD